MANEAVKLNQGGITAPGRPISFTISDNFTVEKGTLMKLSGAYTCAAAIGTGEAFAGITNTEKVAGDGSTTIGVDTMGVFDILAGGTINNGAIVCMSGANQIRACIAADLLTGAAVGKALEAATAGTTIAVAVGFS